MLPSRHIIVSLSLGITVGAFAESLLAGLFCFLSGVLIDVDHLIEYVIHSGLRELKPKKIYQACLKFVRGEEGDIKKVYLFLHTAEVPILLWMSFVFTANLYLLSIALGYTAHLIMDASTNMLRPGAYFITSRIKNGFATIRLIRNFEGAKDERFKELR